MQDPSPNQNRRKKSPQHNSTYKSPYFASVRRNLNINKNRMSAHNAIMITKYPTAHDQTGGFLQNTGQSKKKKVFKRFNKFQQIDQLYSTEHGQPKTLAKDNSKQQDKITRKQSRDHKIHSNPKDIIYSSKTLALVEKYSSYKSIIMSTPKIIKQSKQKIKRNSNFRTKTKSGHTIKWLNSHNQTEILKNTQDKSKSKQKIDVKIQSYNYNDDWLCKQLIQNQVYGMEDDDYI